MQRGEPAQDTWRLLIRVLLVLPDTFRVLMKTLSIAAATKLTRRWQGEAGIRSPPGVLGKK
jgi:hypothetical protein